MPTRAAIVKRAAHYDHYLSGKGFNQKNKFSDFLGLPAEAWCADFVTAIYAMCQLPLPSMQAGHRTGYSYVPDGFAYARRNGAVKSSWEAKPGDIVCYDWGGDPTPQGSDTHTGIVDHWAGGTLYTIEGNSSPGGGVNRHQRTAPKGTGNSQICGVIDTAKLVTFSGKRPPQPHQDDFPRFPGRTLMLKSPYMTGNDVQTWQLQMTARGWQLGTDGEFNERSREVCMQFQEQKDLPEHGRVGPQTWAAAWTTPVTPE
jgi:CHAP domain/Putative peptidoglycan binding domain